MKELDQIERVYFLGIGGIGMSALARFFHASGKTVAGYDRSPTDLTRQLASEGIAIHYDDSVDMIPAPFKSPVRTLVVFTPAVPSEHVEFSYFKEHQFQIYKRSQILGLITRHYKNIAVAGTHGKTTVSTMIAHLLATAGPGCNAFLGGISKNFNSNLVINPLSEWIVTEADEFDRSFLQLYPFAGIITAMDPDHLDIYGDTKSMVEAYNQFVRQIHREGLLLLKIGVPVKHSEVPSGAFTYSLNENSDFRAGNILLEDRKYHFDLTGPGIMLRNLSIEHPGLVNVENAVAATAMAVLLGLNHDRIREALKSFSGIRRRFDYHVKTENVVYIDDYAHHPKEIEAVLHSVRQLYPEKKITGVFQPHLYSRTRDLANDFAKSLTQLDRLIMLDIYPAREEPLPGITSQMIFSKVNIPDKMMCSKDELLEVIKNSGIEVLITLGAGDIDRFVGPIKKLLTAEMK